MEVLSHSFDDGDTLQFPPLVFSTEAAFPAHESSRGPFSPSLGAPSVASEGAPGATCQAGPTRAVLECFAGQAQLASALIKQGYFSYGVDRIKHKSAMAPVLQMDLSSRTACDLILTWLDQQKVAGVMICVPKHELEQLTAAFVYSVIMGCVVRDFPSSWRDLLLLPSGRVRNSCLRSSDHTTGLSLSGGTGVRRHWAGPWSFPICLRSPRYGERRLRLRLGLLCLLLHLQAIRWPLLQLLLRCLFQV